MQSAFLNVAPTPEPQPLRTLLLLTGFILLGMTLGSLLALGWLYWQLPPGESLLNVAAVLQNPARYANGWSLIMGAQALSHVATFFLPPLLLWYAIDHRRWADFSPRPLPNIVLLSLTAALVMALMPANSVLIDWNQHVQLPETLRPLEEWMQAKEKELASLTQYLITFNGVGRLLVAIFVIAVLPALGEEVLFRGVLQRKFIGWTGNRHLGIWLAAVLFSAIHVQFYGFFPRVLLGAAFGYLYAWTGNLWVPILAHFVNNGATVLMMYLYRQKAVSIDIEKADAVAWPVALASVAASSGLLWLIYQMSLIVNVQRSRSEVV